MTAFFKGSLGSHPLILPTAHGHPAWTPPTAQRSPPGQPPRTSSPGQPRGLCRPVHGMGAQTSGCLGMLKKTAVIKALHGAETPRAGPAPPVRPRTGARREAASGALPTLRGERWHPTPAHGTWPQTGALCPPRPGSRGACPHCSRGGATRARAEAQGMTRSRLRGPILLSLGPSRPRVGAPSQNREGHRVLSPSALSEATGRHGSRPPAPSQDTHFLPGAPPGAGPGARSTSAEEPPTWGRTRGEARLRQGAGRRLCRAAIGSRLGRMRAGQRLGLGPGRGRSALGALRGSPCGFAAPMWGELRDHLLVPRPLDGQCAVQQESSAAGVDVHGVVVALVTAPHGLDDAAVLGGQRPLKAGQGPAAGSMSMHPPHQAAQALRAGSDQVH